MTWQPGQSGNPGGRRKKTDDEREAERLAAEYSPRVMRRLMQIVDESDNEFAVMKAGEIILKRTRVGEVEQDAFPDRLEEWTLSHWHRAKALAEKHIAAAETGTEVH